MKRPKMKRRTFLGGLAGAASLGAACLHAPAARATGHPAPPRRSTLLPLRATRPFSERRLLAHARRIAARPYQAPAAVPAEWTALSYDQYRAIWFDHARAVWNGTDASLRVDLLPPGLYYDRAVRVHVVEDGVAREIACVAELFDHTDRLPPLPFPEDLGFSGVRLRGELERSGVFQEYAVFQGASYFRAIARGMIYGASARGLALATGEPQGEEFPDFTAFWVERPGRQGLPHVVHALLESPSVTGLYRFELRPGAPTSISVEARLWPRRRLESVGIAPLTSMFQFDGTNRHRFDDFRSAVHDSNGLAILNGNGEALWRPLANPRRLQFSAFVETGRGPQGFGLAQRARRLSDFGDLEALYHRRPSVWVTPAEPWGPGAVVLVEIPTDREIFDNIVAFWRPLSPLEGGREHRLAYRLDWGERVARPAAVAEVLRTRIGRGLVNSPDRVVAVDFAPHHALPGQFDELEIVVRASAGRVKGGIVQRNPETGGPRLAFRFDPAGAEMAELRAELRHAGRAVSEVWLYRWTG